MIPQEIQKLKAALAECQDKLKIAESRIKA